MAPCQCTFRGSSIAGVYCWFPRVYLQTFHYVYSVSNNGFDVHVNIY